MIKLKKPHTCSCGKVHTEIPDVPLFTDEDEHSLDGYWWRCSCNSNQTTWPDEVEIPPPVKSAA